MHHEFLHGEQGLVAHVGVLVRQVLHDELLTPELLDHTVTSESKSNERAAIGEDLSRNHFAAVI